MFGLLQSDIDQILGIIKDFPQVEEVVVFGSRAMGNFKRGSDVDIALRGSALNRHIQWKIADLLNEETNMPYRFDLFIDHEIENPALRDHIDRHGVIVYRKETPMVVQDPSKDYHNGTGGNKEGNG